MINGSSKKKHQNCHDLLKFEFIHPVTTKKFTSNDLYKEEISDAFHFNFLEKLYDDRNIHFLVHHELKSNESLS